MPTTTHPGLQASLLAALLLPAVAPAAGPPAAAPDGAAIYKAQCARCHGASGEGSKRYKSRLEGDHSVAQLADVVRKTMPEDKPNTLSAAQADAVAAYIHGAFYSKLARERHRPARVELARLTARQYRGAVADLVGTFRPAAAVGQARGLRAEYYKNRRFRPADRVLQRTDAQVAFDFGTDSPVPDKTEHHEFSIRWSGSLLVERTGEYQFVIRTEHAARLWVNDLKTPLLDAWVKSGNDTEYRATIFLVAGRAYPLRLEYSKAKQGVNDAAKQKKPPPRVKSSVVLMWKVPGRGNEAIPSRHLMPTTVAESFVCATPFPPDDRSYGWERGTTVSKEWDAATTDAALEAAGYVAARLDELAGASEGDPKRNEKLLAFGQRFADRAFRRPLSAEQRKLVARQFLAARDAETGVKRVVLVVLKSPRFLYREAGGPGDGYDVAARLSFGLWGSLPDQALLTAAAEGRLATREEVGRQAARMMTDPRARVKLRDFLLGWLHAESSHDLARDAKRFPGFDAAVISDLRGSLEAFLDEVVWSDDADFRQLLLSDQVPLNERLAKFYGAEGVKGDAFQPVKLDAGQRAGVLSHPYLMASFAHNDESSPIHRGVFLARGVLGVSLKPPPDAVAPLAPALHPGLTTRERVALQTRPAACMTCHNIINPLGFALEHFDAVGRFRSKEKEKAIDATGSYRTREGKQVKVNGARELAAFLADSPEAHAAFVEQMFHDLVQQPARAYGPDTLARLTRSFAANKFHVRKLAVEVLVTAALKGAGIRENK